MAMSEVIHSFCVDPDLPNFIQLARETAMLWAQENKPPMAEGAEFLVAINFTAKDGANNVTLKAETEEGVASRLRFERACADADREDDLNGNV